MPGLSDLKYVLVAFLLLFLSFGLVKSTFEVLKSNKRLEDLNKEVSVLEEEKSVLTENIAYKQTNEYIEERAREDLNLVKPGEKVYVIVGDDAAKVLSESSIRLEKKEKPYMNSNWYMWYRLFF